MLTIISIIVGVMGIVVNIYNGCTRQNHQKERQGLKTQKMRDGLMCVFPKTIPIFSDKKPIISKLKKLCWQLFTKVDYFLYFNLLCDRVPSHIENEQMETILTIEGSDQSITNKELKRLKKAKKTYMVDLSGERYEIPCNFYL